MTNGNLEISQCLNSESKIFLRVGLSQASAHAYSEMVERLKRENAHLKISPSKFVDFIVSRYFDFHFENEKNLIARNFFNSREYLNLELRKASTNEDLRETLKRVMGELSSSKKRKTRKKKAASPDAKSD